MTEEKLSTLIFKHIDPIEIIKINIIDLIDNYINYIGESNLFYHCIENSYFEAFKWFVQHEYLMLDKESVLILLKHGKLKFLQWIYENKQECFNHTFLISNYSFLASFLSLLSVLGFYDLKNWLKDNYQKECIFSNKFICNNNKYDELNDWFEKNEKYEYNIRFLIVAIKSNKIYFFPWDKNYNPYDFEYSTILTNFPFFSHFLVSILDLSANFNHLDIVKWLHDSCNMTCTKYAMNKAAENGHLHIVKWLHENRTEGCSIIAMNKAAENGHLDIVKWLHENRTEGCTTKAMDFAAKNGHLDVIKWLHENRTEGCTQHAIFYAAEYGHFEIVKWLRTNRTEECELFHLDWVIEHGHLEALLWLHDHNYCIDE
jgi:hypothetical protein